MTTRSPSIGRMGVAIIAARRVQIERNSFTQMSLDVLDIEPDWANQGAEDVLFKDNTIGTYAHSDLYRSHVLSICGTAAAPVRNVTVDNNVVTGGRQVNARNSAGGVTARADRTNRTNIRFTNNRSTTARPGLHAGLRERHDADGHRQRSAAHVRAVRLLAQQHERHVPIGIGRHPGPCVRGDRTVKSARLRACTSRPSRRPSAPAPAC